MTPQTIRANRVPGPSHSAFRTPHSAFPLIVFVVDQLVAGERAQGAEHGAVDVLTDEADVAVGEQEEATALVPALEPVVVVAVAVGMWKSVVTPPDVDGRSPSTSMGCGCAFTGAVQGWARVVEKRRIDNG